MQNYNREFKALIDAYNDLQTKISNDSQFTVEHKVELGKAMNQLAFWMGYTQGELERFQEDKR